MLENRSMDPHLNPDHTIAIGRIHWKKIGFILSNIQTVMFMESDHTIAIGRFH